MGIKNFLKPNKNKILIWVVLILILVFFLYDLLFLLNFIQSYNALYISSYFLLYSAIHIPLAIIIVLLLTYPSACYIHNTKNWFRGVAYYFAAYVVLSLLVVQLINLYNIQFGNRCSKDDDCIRVCDWAQSKRYIELSGRNYPHCISNGFPICDKNQCKLIDIPLN